MKKNFEDIIRKKAEGFEKQPPADAWEQIRQGMGRARGFATLKQPLFWTAIAIVCVVGFGILWQLFEGDNAIEKTANTIQHDQNSSPKSKVDSSALIANATKSDTSIQSPVAVETEHAATQQGRVKNDINIDRIQNPSENATGHKNVNNKPSNPVQEQVSNANNTGVSTNNNSAGNGKTIANSDVGKQIVKSDLKDRPREDTVQVVVAVPKDSVSSTNSLAKQASTFDTATKKAEKRKLPGHKDREQGMWDVGFFFGKIYSQNNGFRYAEETSNGSRWPPMSANFNPSSPATTDYRSYRDSTDVSASFAQYGFNLGYHFNRFFSVHLGLSWFSLGRKYRGADDYYFYSYNPSTEGSIKIDSSTFLPIYNAENASYFTPLGNSYLQQRYRYISIPISLDAQVFRIGPASLKANLGMAYNMYRKSTDVYYFDYNNYRYFKLSNDDQSKYMRKNFYSFSPGLTVQYNISDHWNLSIYGQYTFIRNSVYNNRSYLKEYYNAWGSGLRIGYAFSQIKKK